MIAIPVSLIGCFLIMSGVGLTFNTLSLFGLVLAIGIVVDDAIVVVENVERYLEHGMSPKEAAHKTMDEVGGALLAIAIGAVCGIYPGRLHHRAAGRFLQAIRDHDRQRHGDFGVRVFDLIACAGRHPIEAASAGASAVPA